MAEKQNGNAAQFTIYRAIELVLCLLVVLVGVLYLKWRALPLGLVLPVYIVTFVAIPILRYFDGRKRGVQGTAQWLTVGIASLPAIALIVALVVYAAQG